MIVKIAAWYYLVNAGLAVLSLLFNPYGFLSGTTLMAVIFAGLFGAMGFGLLQRAKWARFMALGCSLLGWTLGVLLLIGLLGFLLLFAGAAAALVWMAVLTMVLGAVGVFISFKLFWHLCSPEGCEEFGEPPISAPTVVASAGAWLGLALVNIVATGGGQSVHELAVSGVAGDADENARRAQLHEFERQQTLREQAARRAAASPQGEAESSAPLEATQPDDQAEDATPGEPVETADAVVEAEAAEKSGDAVAPEASEAPEANEQQSQPSEESAAPEVPATTDAASAAKDGDAPAARKIVKCRDKSGGVTFTQGYCPPGTRQVDMN